MGLLKRVWAWFDDRTGISQAVKPAIEHPIPEDTVGGKGWMYVLGTGLLVTFILQLVTGAVLTTKYIPSAAHAYDSLQFITNDLWFGRLIRGMHFFGASAMMLLLALHMARVYLTGSYKFPREMNWITGVLLLVFTVMMALTGQLLRWNEDGVWTVVVAAYFVGRIPLVGDSLVQFMLGGDTIGGATLSRFFSFHVFWMPGLIIMLITAHMLLVLRNGVSEPPKPGEPVDKATYRQKYHEALQRTGKPYFPYAVWKEATFAVVVVGSVVVLALIFGARELGPPPDPGNLVAEPIPDWFLIWYYALITVKPRELDDLVMVYLPLIVFVLLLLLPIISSDGERSPARRPWAVLIVGFGGLAFATLIVLGLEAPWVPAYETEQHTAESLGTTRAEVLEGAEIYFLKGCQYCHAVAGRGGRWGPDLTDVTKRMSPQEVAVWVTYGRGEMPSYRYNMTTEELDRIIAFLRFLGEADRPEIPARPR